jgi:hypothetical protein
MTPIELRLPRGKAKVIYNSLYADRALAHLTEDVALVDLGNNVLIDVGWYPDRDPAGSYRINVYQGQWHKQLRKPIRTKDPHRVAEQIQKLASRFSTSPRGTKVARSSKT